MTVLVQVICVTFYWLTIATTFTIPSDITDGIEVYRIFPVSKTITINNTEAEVDLSTSLVKFSSGFTCDYHSGTCHDAKTNKWYHWEVEDTLCENLILIYKNLYDLQPKSDSLVVFQNGSSMVVLSLTREEKICDRKLWWTNHSELVVAVGQENFFARQSDSISYLDDNKVGSLVPGESLKETTKLKEENARLKDNLNSLQYQLDSINLELSRLSDGVKQLKSDKHLTKRSVPESTNSFPGPVFNSFCNNFYLFPCENVLLAFVIISYITFSVINTVMNYSSLRMLQIRKDNSITFYSLTQGLTTRYMCRTMGFTKMKVDKWLLDIETPLK